MIISGHNFKAHQCWCQFDLKASMETRMSLTVMDIYYEKQL